MSFQDNLTGPPLTAEYEPPYQSYASFLYDPNRPIFTPLAVDAMLTDARVTLGMAMLRGPILSNSRFFVHCDNPEAKQFIASQINRFWRNSADISLDSMQYGYQPAEIIYRSMEGQLQFDKLKYIHPRDAKPRLLKGIFCGMDVNGLSGRDQALFIGSPKAFWSTNRRRKHRWFGQSQLYGSFPPWYEKWGRRGFRDQKQLFFYKMAFRGPIIQYPVGAVPPVTGSPDGTPGKDNRRIAQEIGDKFITGSTLCLPAPDPNKPSWNFIDAQTNGTPDGFLQYGHDLDDEILEGMEIPPEIARSSSGGEGISIGSGGGRDIPQQAFYSILSQNCLSLMTDIDEQILNPLVQMKWGKDLFYEIEAFGLLRGQDSDQEPGAMEQSQADPTTNMGEEDGTDVQMSARSFSGEERLKVPSRIVYNLNEERRLIRTYRKHSDFQFLLGRSA